MAQLLDAKHVATDSALEVLVLQLIRESGLPLPVPQYEIRTPAGIRVARLDFAYPGERIGIEADSYRHHSNPVDWARDRAKQNAANLLGWVVQRATWDDVTKRGSLWIRELSQLLSRRRSAG